jgi:uncharacterized membrane protein YeaQ/YmgE (transglycosylase-associated protein family)
VVGIVGGVVGGWFATQMGSDRTTGFIGAVAIAFLGAVVVRLVLRALEGGRRF